MRNLRHILEEKYGKNTISIFRNWEKMEGKVSDYQSHRRFLLRCLSQGVTPVSLRLKNLTRTQKGDGIIKRAEKQLLNERIRNINNKIEKYQHDKYMYENQLHEILKEDQVMWNACKEEVLKRKELRHQKVLSRQISKFERLIQGRKKQEQGGHSNKDNCTDKGQSTDKEKDKVKKRWVINLSSIPLTKQQEDLLSHGPNFAISPKKPPLGEYILNIEKACQSLDTNMAEELRSEVYRVLKKPHHPKPNLKREEFIALEQLKSDKSQMIHTADKGVALVVLDTVDYIRKAKEILEDTNTYRVIQTDPTSRLKNKLINMLRRIKTATGIHDNIYRKMYPTGASPPKFYGLPKIHKANIPSGP